MRILLVEDNDSDAMVAQAAVEKALRGPREILRAASLANGLAIVGSMDVDLVLLDLNLPDSRGVSTLKRMRVATTCPIIVVTIEDRPGLDEEALGNGAFEILHKGRLGPDAIVRLLRLAEDRRRAQGSLENAEHRFRSLTELSSDWFWEQDKELRWTFFSSGYWPRSGATPEMLLGKRRWEEPGRAPLRGTWEEHRAMLEARKTFRDCEFMRVNQDGTRTFQAVNGEPFYDKAGEFAGYRGTSRDITERKLAEEALDRARSRLDLALAASRVCTWDVDVPSGEVVLSETWAEVIGARPGETRTTVKALAELVHPEDLVSLRRTLIEVIKGLSTEYAVEHRVRHQTGEWRWIISRGKVVERDARGRALRMVGTNLDISERKHAENQLRESETRFRSLTELSSDWYWEQDENFRFVNFSKSADQHDSPDLFIGKTRWELPGVDASEQIWVEHRATLQAHAAFRDFEFRRLTASGDVIWLSVIGMPIFDEQGRFKGYRGSARNITGRKQGEALLSGEKQVLEMIATGAPLEEILTALMRVLEAQFPGMLCSVLLLDPDGVHLRHGAAPSLPEDYTRAIDGLAIGASVGSCGTAAFRREPVIVEDVASDPLWADFRELALGHGLRACWSTPIFNAQGHVLGTFAIYYRQPGLPTAQHRWLIDFGTQLAAIAITRRQAESALRESEARFRSLTELSSDWYWEQDENFRFVYFSDSVEKHGSSPASHISKTRWALPHVDVSEERWAEHRAVLEAHQPFRDFEFQRVTELGDTIWMSASGTPIFDEQGRFKGYRGIGSDITEKKRADEALRESEARFRSLTELSSDYYWEQDEQFRFTRRIGVPEEVHVLPDDDVIGKRRWELPGTSLAPEAWAQHRADLEAHRKFRNFEFEWSGAAEEKHWVNVSGEPLFDASGAFRGYRGVGSDITVRKSAEKRLAYLAHFDAVTGLPNRKLLQEKLEQAIVQARRHGRGAGVLFIDIDRFKLVNDTLGHQAGDALLAQVGRSLRDCVRQDDTVGRLAGDEFAVVIADLALPEDAALVAQKIVDSFAAPFDLKGQEIFLTASIGIAAFPGDGEDADALLRCADAAMYRAKEVSRNSFCFYTAEMNARTAAKLQLNNDLRRAVERKEFRLHYQPKVNLASGALTGMEALLRWQHPKRGMVSPLEFIPALEDTGLIVAVGDWVVEEACRQLRDWTRDGLEPVPIAVNLSARQFRRRDLDAVISGIVEAHGLQAGMLELEITESSLMLDPTDAIRQLHALRAAGLRISVDDFGTGYSSLSYLTRLPLSTLKIDRSFVNAAITDPLSAAIVRMVIDMAQNLRFDVVAEGIETDQHVAFLRQHGCEQGQGYHFGRPAPAEEVAARLSRRA